MSLMGVLHRLFRAANPRVRELAQLPLFQCLSQQQLALLAAHLDEVKVEAGRTLIREGCPNSAFWVLLEGEVELFIANTRHRVLPPGDVFGVSTMLDRRLALATVRTRTSIRPWSPVLHSSAPSRAKTPSRRDSGWQRRTGCEKTSGFTAWPQTAA